jgi:hypothetical protein
MNVRQARAAENDSTPPVPRLTMRGVVSDAVRHFFDLESGWLRTVRELTLAPGSMIRRYVSVERKVYANPFAYLVFGTAATLVVQNVVGFHDRIVSAVRATTLASPLQMELVNSFTDLVFQNSLYISIGIIVPLTVCVRLLFRKSGYNLAEDFVFALYVSGHLALLGIVLVPLYMLLPPSQTIQAVVGLSIAIAYTVFAAHGFFEGHFAVIAIKTGVAYLVAYASFMIAMMTCVAAYVLLVMLPGSSGEPWDLVTATDYEVIPVIENLLDDGADVNATLQRTALHAAAENGNVEIIELLIGHGADVNRQDIHGRIPLFVALAEHQLDAARRLAEEPTDVSVRTSDGSTLLIEAVRAEDERLVRWALDKGVDINAVRPGKNAATALIMAVRKKNVDLVSLLLSRGADPGISNKDGKTALDLARGDAMRDLLRPSGG